MPASQEKGIEKEAATIFAKSAESQISVLMVVVK